MAVRVAVAVAVAVAAIEFVVRLRLVNAVERPWLYIFRRENENRVDANVDTNVDGTFTCLLIAVLPFDAKDDDNDGDDDEDKNATAVLVVVADRIIAIKIDLEMRNCIAVFISNLFIRRVRATAVP